MLCFLQGTLFCMMLLAVSSSNDGAPPVDETVVCWSDVWLSKGLACTEADDNTSSASHVACISYLQEFTHHYWLLDCTEEEEEERLFGKINVHYA